MIDNSGFVLAHYDWIENAKNGKEQLKIHLAHQEPYIAQILIDNNILTVGECIDIVNVRKQKFWNVSTKYI